MCPLSFSREIKNTSVSWGNTFLRKSGKRLKTHNGAGSFISWLGRVSFLPFLPPDQIRKNLLCGVMKTEKSFHFFIQNIYWMSSYCCRHKTQPSLRTYPQSLNNPSKALWKYSKTPKLWFGVMMTSKTDPGCLDLSRKAKGRADHVCVPLHFFFIKHCQFYLVPYIF